MPSLTSIGLFSIAAILLALTPGPDMLYIATRSITQGRSAGVVSALGVHTGVLVHTFAAALGLSAIIAASSVAFSLVRFAGAGYLIFLGIKTLLGKAEVIEVNTAEHFRLRQIFAQGLITNVLNPKVILFFIAFLPQFVDPTLGNITLQLVVLGLLLFIVALPIDIVVGLAGGSLHSWVGRRNGVQQASKWVTGSVFIALGIGTALHGTWSDGGRRDPSSNADTRQETHPDRQMEIRPGSAGHPADHSKAGRGFFSGSGRQGGRKSLGAAPLEAARVT